MVQPFGHSGGFHGVRIQNAQGRRRYDALCSFSLVSYPFLLPFVCGKKFAVFLYMAVDEHFDTVALRRIHCPADERKKQRKDHSLCPLLASDRQPGSLYCHLERNGKEHPCTYHFMALAAFSYPAAALAVYPAASDS
jgi:hypothetical protein